MSDRPASLRVEATSSCQLRCPSCPTASGATRPVLGRGFLRVPDFERLLADNPFVRSVELSNYGEILLHPDLIELMRCAHRHAVELTADNGVNMNHAPDEVLEAMVRYRFRSLTCSIDGASPQTYSRYRVRGDFDRVIANITRLNEHKRAHRSTRPSLTWQFVVFGHNEHEIPAAMELARELGMAFLPKINWDPALSPVRDPARVARLTGLPVEIPLDREGSDYGRSICHQLWNSPQINWDGKLTGCCVNHWGDFGANVFRDGLQPALRSEPLLHARAMLMGQREPRDDVPCARCFVYERMRATGRFLTPVEVRLPVWASEALRRHLHRLPGARALLSAVLRSWLALRAPHGPQARSGSRS